MHVEADALAARPIAVALEHPHLVERAAQVDAGERLVLVELEPVLIVEVDGPKLARRQRELHLVGGVEPGEDAVGGLEQPADPGGSLVR